MQILCSLAVDPSAEVDPFETVTEDVLGERMEVLRHRARSLREVVDRSLGFGDVEYLVVGDRRISYADHHALVAALARRLRDEFGVGPGDRVAILAANCPEWIITFWASLSLGAIAVGMNGWWVGDEIRYGLADAEPKVLVADQRRLDRLDGDDPGMPVLMVETDFPRTAEPSPLPDNPIAEDDPALILYTSGTSGRPKGALLSHRNIVAQLGIQTKMLADRIGGLPQIPSGIRNYVHSPMFHVSGLLAGCVYGLTVGSTHVLHQGRFDPAVVLEAIERERCTATSLVPTVGWRLANHPDARTRDLSSLQTMGGGAAPLPPALLDRLREVFPQATQRMGWGYGMTECCALATTAGPADLAANPVGNGRPLPTVQVEIRDADGRPLPPGEEGEICIRSPLVMLEYWRKPEATEAALAEGRWYRTGDLGAFVDGQLVLSSRRSDLILRGGENVYPAEIEHLLDTHPDVAESVVVGVPDDELGQRVKAIVVLRPDAPPTDLAGWVADRLAYYKVPEQWEWRTEPLPRTATGKVVRQALDDGRASFVEE